MAIGDNIKARRAAGKGVMGWVDSHKGDDNSLAEIQASSVRIDAGVNPSTSQSQVGISKIDISKVPPPKSKTAIFSSCFLSKP